MSSNCSPTGMGELFPVVGSIRTTIALSIVHTAPSPTTIRRGETVPTGAIGAEIAPVFGSTDTTPWANSMPEVEEAVEEGEPGGGVVLGFPPPRIRRTERAAMAATTAAAPPRTLRGTRRLVGGGR